MGTELHYFDWLESKPKLQATFNTVMGISCMNRGEDRIDFYPVEDRLRVAGSQTLLVDVGGGLGHDLIAFRRRFPKLLRKLIVQDIILGNAESLPSGIEAMKYDFFTPQPIKNAKVYYLRTVLHDWPDKQTGEILDNIRLSMDRESILR